MQDGRAWFPTNPWRIHFLRDPPVSPTDARQLPASSAPKLPGTSGAGRSSPAGRPAPRWRPSVPAAAARGSRSPLRRAPRSRSRSPRTRRRSASCRRGLQRRREGAAVKPLPRMGVWGSALSYRDVTMTGAEVPCVPPPAALFSLPDLSSPTWLRRVRITWLLRTVSTPLHRAGFAGRRLTRPRPSSSGLGSDQERGAAERGGGAGRGRAADVGPDPVGLGLCPGAFSLVHGGEGLEDRRARPALIWALRSREGSFASVNPHQSGNRAKITAASEEESSHVWQMSTAPGSSVSAGPGRPPWSANLPLSPGGQGTSRPGPANRRLKIPTVPISARFYPRGFQPRGSLLRGDPKPAPRLPRPHHRGAGRGRGRDEE